MGAFNNNATLGRILLLIGAYSPAVLIVAFRTACSPLSVALGVISIIGIGFWIAMIRFVVPLGPGHAVQVDAIDPMDREVTAYVSTYLFPTLAATPSTWGAWVAYALAAVLLLVVAYRADLGAVNPVAYLCKYRVLRISAGQTATIVLTRRRIRPGETWELRSRAGLFVADERVA